MDDANYLEYAKTAIGVHLGICSPDGKTIIGPIEIGNEMARRAVELERMRQDGYVTLWNEKPITVDGGYFVNVVPSILKVTEKGLQLVSYMIADVERKFQATPLPVLEAYLTPDSKLSETCRAIAQRIYQERHAEKEHAEKEERRILAESEDRRHQESIQAQENSTLVAKKSAWIAAISAVLTIVVSIAAAWYAKVQAETAVATFKAQQATSNPPPIASTPIPTATPTVKVNPLPTPQATEQKTPSPELPKEAK